MFTAIAEDHILAWELVSKRGSSWLLYYVKSAYATKEVPSRVSDLIIGQRWLNAFFAAIYSTSHFYYIHRSDHSFFRKFWIYVGLLYQFCGLIVSWFTLVRSIVVLLSMALMRPTGKLLHFILHCYHLLGELHHLLPTRPYRQQGSQPVVYVSPNDVFYPCSR
jgi:chitin synthase